MSAGMMDILFVGMIILIPLLADVYVRLTYKKYLKINNNKKICGQEVARMILDKNGLNDIYVVETNGFLSDHYDPNRKTIRLSSDVFHGETVAALAIAAHECGHAIQDKDGYKFMKLRSAIVPIVNIATSISMYIILISFIFGLFGLFTLGIAFTSLGLIFQIVTLPVEFNASSRAKKELHNLRVVNAAESSGVKAVLTSAALTYVAGVLASALQIIRLIVAFNDRD